MTEEYVGIKEKIRSILNSENTTTFLNNISKPLGKNTKRGIVISKQENINCFLENVFNNDDDDYDISIEDFGKNNVINNLIINDKRINVKTLSSRSNKIYFNTFKFREGDDFDVKENLEKTMEKLKIYDYFLLIIIKRSRKNKPFSVEYDFYLKSTKEFFFDVRVFYKTKAGYCGDNWKIQSNKEFYFVINKKNSLKDKYYSYFYKVNS